MDIPSEIRNALVEGKNLIAAGKTLDAERIYRALAAKGSHRALILEALADLLIDQQRTGEVLEILRELRAEDPDSIRYCGLLAEFYDTIGDTRAASDEYQQFVEQHPDSAIANYNLALLLRKQQRGAEAIAAYEAALQQGIDQPEEVYSNMGVVYSEMQDADAATAMYQRSLEIAPDYVPALFNLAGHYEELGELQLAIEQYERILEIDPLHWRSLARLAYPNKVDAENRAIIGRLNDGIARMSDDRQAQEGLHFALGKAYDDLGEFDAAADAYRTANEISKQRVLPYAPAATEAAFDELIRIFNQEWIDQVSTDSESTPVFICGMYRSGSTLLERMLGAHPEIAAGGELSVLGWLTNRYVGPFPAAAPGATREALSQIADDYSAAIRELQPGSAFVIDKQPDNFLRAALIRAIFPKARIIRTRRDIRDNSLSLYFQQFDRAASYANDMANIAHYYRQQERAFEHWETMFPDNLITVDYEELIEDPETHLRRVLEFIGVEWNPAVLEFQRNKGLVKTASIWQVRQGLHSGSRGRWHNYGGLLSDLEIADEPQNGAE